MGGMSVDGLVSGLNTTDLVAQLMRVEAIPQDQLKSRVASTNKIITALQGINTRAASLATAATTLADPKTWSAVKAISSDTSVVVSASASAGAGAVTFDVVSTAKAHSVAGPEIEWPPAGGVPAPTATTITVTRAAQDPQEIEATSADPRDLAAAINASGESGVTAAAIQVREGVYRLQLTAIETGADSTFDFSIENVAGANLLMQQASDATISLNGTLPVTSETNTFTDVLPGTTFTISKEGLADVTIEVQSDSAAVTTAVSGFVNNLNVLLTDMASQTKAPVASSKAAAGPLVGNSTIRRLNQSLLGASSGVVAGTTVASTGIEITRDGTVTFDEAALKDLLAADPVKAQEMITALATQVGDVATNASKSDAGAIGQLITNREGMVKDFTTQIESWDRRLELRESSLRRQFSALEVALSNMTSQSSWLAGQLAGLSSSANS